MRMVVMHFSLVSFFIGLWWACCGVRPPKVFLIYFDVQDRATQRCDLSGSSRLKAGLGQGACFIRSPVLPVVRDKR